LSTKTILAIYTDTGTKHDITMLIQSKLWIKFQANTCYLDAGFQGIQTYLPNAITPYKKPKNTKKQKFYLTQEQKLFNKQLARLRVPIEHINRKCKIFRICKHTRRHKQNKHNLFWNLVAGLVNFKALN
jgi:hypothetical protein